MYDPKSDGKDRISRKIIAKTSGLVVPEVFLYEYIEKGNQSLKNSTDASFSVPRSHITSTDLSPNLNT